MSDTYPDGVRAVETLEPDGQVHIHLAREVDLDDLMLWLMGHRHDDGIGTRADDDWWEYHGDFPTRIAEADREVEVGRFRKQPCVCGEGHAYDVFPVNEDQNQRGTYLGVMTR